MINNLFSDLIYNFLKFVTTPLRNLADVSLPAAISAAITTSQTWFAIISQLFDLTGVLTMLFTMIAIEIAIFGYKIIKWVYVKIPGVN